MQVVTEGIALYSFRDMRNQTREPLLKEMLTYVSRDEARHTGFGVKYLAAVVPSLSEREIREVEDFAFEAARLLIDSRAGLSMRDSVMSLWSQAGVDPKHALTEIAKDRGKVLEAIQRSGGRRGPVRGFVIPTLRAIGLFSERVRAHFEEMFVANVGAAVRQDQRRRSRLPGRSRGLGREQLEIRSRPPDRSAKSCTAARQPGVSQLPPSASTSIPSQPGCAATSAMPSTLAQDQQRPSRAPRRASRSAPRTSA